MTTLEDSVGQSKALSQGNIHSRLPQGGELQMLNCKMMECTQPLLRRPPRTLAEPWEECQFGMGNRKPAKDFTGTEHCNRCFGIKQKCHRCKFVWLTVEKLIEQGHTGDAAVHKIRSSCGFRCSVTQIVNFMIGQHKNGGTGQTLSIFTPFFMVACNQTEQDGHCLV